jgi:hypothetical protein
MRYAEGDTRPQHHRVLATPLPQGRQSLKNPIRCDSFITLG